MGRKYFSTGRYWPPDGTPPLKMRSFVRVLSNFAPVPSGLTDRGVSKKQQQAVIARHSRRLGRGLPRVVQRSGAHPWPYPAHGEAVPAGKLDTTSTVLSSGEALKKTNFVGVLSNSRVSSRSRFGGRSTGAFPPQQPAPAPRLGPRARKQSRGAAGHWTHYGQWTIDHRPRTTDYGPRTTDD